MPGAPVKFTEPRPVLLAQAPDGEAAAGRVPRPRPGVSESSTAAEPPGVTPAEAPETGVTPATGTDSDTTPFPADNSPTTTAALVEPAVMALAPLPRPRPDPAATPPKPQPASFFGFEPDPLLRSALDAVADGRYAQARATAAEHDDPLALTLVAWLIAREPDSGLTAAEVIDLIQSHPDWPDQDRIRLQAERAFHELGPDNETILTFYSLTTPRTIGGKLALAGALRASGRRTEAADIVRELWRDTTLASNQAAALLSRFGAELKQDDHLYRFRRLVLNRRDEDATTQAALLGVGYAGLAKAVIAVLDRSDEGPRLLRAVEPRFFGDPLYVLARIKLLHRAGKPLQAARLMLQLEPDAELPGDGDIWWDERRDLSRRLLDLRTPDLAYRLVAANQAAGDTERVEAAFHAGWYALRFLKDPQLAVPHFRDLLTLATLPRTRARATYWLGRAYEAAGKDAAARMAFTDAAQFGGTFYGQLARERVGALTTGLERLPSPSALDRIRFAGRDAVKAIRLLAAAGHAESTFPFFRALGASIETAGELTLLANLARRIDLPHAGIAAATIAEQRGVEVASLQAPFLGVPAGVPMPNPVDRALVYAIVRQESAFNHGATSHVGARGLMQLMPGTAKETARRISLPYSAERLTADPFYNATLGAQHLGELMDRLDSSYVLTFVSYNAGPGRARDWVKAYGDPRGGSVDPVDWIERIPFDETRNYVQKVMENLQTYRSRVGHPLSVSEDLIRGGTQG